MKTIQSLINNIIQNTDDQERVMMEFTPFKDGSIVLSIGFIEQILNYDFTSKSKEAKLIDKIIANSYEFHKLDDNLEYVNAQNEHR